MNSTRHNTVWCVALWFNLFPSSIAWCGSMARHGEAWRSMAWQGDIALTLRGTAKGSRHLADLVWKQNSLYGFKKEGCRAMQARMNMGITAGVGGIWTKGHIYIDRYLDGTGAWKDPDFFPLPRSQTGKGM
jgi:hypothetical protein